MEQKTGIIIQARLGSTRLPNKLLKKFYFDKTIIDILIEKLLAYSNNFKIILATTTNPVDDLLYSHCRQYPILLFRGSEQNVTDRFIEAAKQFHVDTIIRVCADNPFFDVSGTVKLLDFWNPNMDYLSYKMHSGRPTIKSHLGFWGELVSLSALHTVNKSTTDDAYLQHVTNFVYEHPEQFANKLIDAPDDLGKAENIRLTLDTEGDFATLKKLYTKLIGKKIELSPKNIADYVKSSPEIMIEMAKQIEQNSK